jgi:polysaccharide biosynthesis/export protein
MRWSLLFSLSLVVVRGPGVAGEASGVRGPEDVAKPAAVTLDQSTPGGPQLRQRYPRYAVRAGDVLEVSFAPATEFNQTVAVEPDGYAAFREIGELYVHNKTLPELRQELQAAYSVILYEPVITVVLKDFEKPHFTVGGHVARPGKYDLRADTTASEAVAVAGGVTEKARHSEVLLFRRVSDDWVEVLRIDLKAMLSKGQLGEDVHLRPGDMLYVPQNRLSKLKPFLPIWSVGTFLGVNPRF